MDQEVKYETRNNRRDYAGQIEEAQREKKFVQLVEDKKRKKITENFNDSINAQTEYYEDQLVFQKRDHDRVISEQKTSMEKDKIAQVRTLREQMVKQAEKYEEKMTNIIDTYESQIRQMRADFNKKWKRQSDANREQITSLNKANMLDREAAESKVQARINQQQHSLNAFLKRF
ncbi:MAG: hypothetical protein IPM57_03000 [Oligoflexia bacterium]|nr:hypothetical protein [Oligoflexia bacterium]